ncbi:hypothetical protein F5050DRAFT_1124113 [Lentinula boryana]|uniref:Uncharacterized protein n=1 Tax=Lentinula boryana TaxID=40481 RepID=A0ABQ8PYU7_9AGAR|nr:hypothetical protein F5050DRAFT_1124113 [Lentinula boryana]
MTACVRYIICCFLSSLHAEVYQQTTTYHYGLSTNLMLLYPVCRLLEVRSISLRSRRSSVPNTEKPFRSFTTFVLMEQGHSIPHNYLFWPLVLLLDVKDSYSFLVRSKVMRIHDLKQTVFYAPVSRDTQNISSIVAYAIDGFKFDDTTIAKTPS